MWKRFHTKGEFSWREKSLCTGMGGGRNHCAQCSYESKPQTRAGPPPSLLLFHHIFTSTSNINYSVFFVMIEHIILDPVTDFWKFPIKGFKQMISLAFFNTYLRSPYCYLGGQGWDLEGLKGPLGG